MIFLLAATVWRLWHYPNAGIRSLHEVYVRRLVGHVPLAKAIITFGGLGSYSVENMLVTASVAKTSAAHQSHVQQTHFPCDDVWSVREAARIATHRFKFAQRIATKPEHELAEAEKAVLDELADGTLWRQMVEAHEERRRVKPPRGVLLQALMRQ